jgi:hypothetical protein
MYNHIRLSCYKVSALRFGCAAKCRLNKKGECGLMVEKPVNYPAYTAQSEGIKAQKVTMFMTYEQALEIASLIYYINKVLAWLPKWLGGIRLDEYARALHKSIHDSCVNCCLSLEEKDRMEKDGRNNHE